MDILENMDESLNLVFEEENWSLWEDDENIEAVELDNFDTNFLF